MSVHKTNNKTNTVIKLIDTLSLSLTLSVLFLLVRFSLQLWSFFVFCCLIHPFYYSQNGYKRQKIHLHPRYNKYLSSFGLSDIRLPLFSWLILIWRLKKETDFRGLGHLVKYSIAVTHYYVRTYISLFVIYPIRCSQVSGKKQTMGHSFYPLLSPLFSLSPLSHWAEQRCTDRSLISVCFLLWASS